MPLISKKDADFLRNEFDTKLVSPVKLLMFTQRFECQFCAETRKIVEEIAALSDKITIEIYNFVTDKEVAEKYAIDKNPAMAVLKDGDQPKDYGIRFYGIPSGYEFSSLIEDIMMVSHGESGLSEASKAQVAALTRPVHIQVFVTPT